MTSKSLFFKILIEDLKRRIWTIVLASIVFFLYFPILGTLMIGNYNQNIYDLKDYKERLLDRILGFMGPQDYMVAAITVIGAVICGLSGFFYLHSKKKVDFYHSLPVRREVLFGVSYINGVLIYIIPYIANIIVYSIILQLNGLMNTEMFTTTLSAIGINILFYILIYTVVIIAVMLTGNFVISVFGTGVFLLYGPMLMMLKEIYYLSFFKTYYTQVNTFSEMSTFLSPIGSYVDVASRVGVDNQGIGRSILITILVIILFIAFALFLYKKRPSEAASKAMAFSISKPVIKFLLVIPLSLGGGIIFREITDRSSNGWFIFGLLFALIFVYAVIEVIYNFDIKSAFNHKKHLLICGIIIAVVACIFKFDVFHYDTYIPKKDSIRSMSVSISGLDELTQYHDWELINGSYLNYMNSQDYQLKFMKLTDMDAAYNMAVSGIKNIDVTENDAKYLYYNVKFHLKSGREITRSYQLKTSESYGMLSDIYGNQEFKEGHYPIYKSDINLITEISCYNRLQNKQITLNQNEKKELIDMFKEELSKLTLEEISNASPAAVLSLQMYNINENYNIYPSFEKTIAFLKSHGFDAANKVEAKNIKQITIQNYRTGVTKEYDIMYKDADFSYSQVENGYIDSDGTLRTVTYDNTKDAEKIEEIFPDLVDNDYYWRNQSVIGVEDSIGVEVVIRKDEFGNEGRYSYQFRKGAIPDFVKEAIELETSN